MTSNAHSPESMSRAARATSARTPSYTSSKSVAPTDNSLMAWNWTRHNPRMAWAAIWGSGSSGLTPAPGGHSRGGDLHQTVHHVALGGPQ